MNLTPPTPGAQPTPPKPLVFPQPNILIVGESSTGKTYSLRNMPWDKTAFIDTEVKGFPFPVGEAFARNYFPVEDFRELLPTIAKIRERTDIRYLVIDSFTDFNTQACLGARKDCAGQKDGFEAYRRNTGYIFDFLKACKSKTQITIVTALPEILTGVDNMAQNQALTRRAKVQGREMEGTIEPAFVYSFCSRFVTGAKTPEDSYRLLTQSDGVNLAKSPPGVFKDALIPNDMAKVVAAIEARVLV